MKSSLQAYLSLSKPRIVVMVLVVTALGFFLAGHGVTSYGLLAVTLAGTALCCAGSAALNNYMEREIDPKMNRTCRRPIPLGKIAPADALSYGLLLVTVGTILLVTQVNLLTGFLALLTAFLYVLVYTPLKRRTWLNTFFGAIPGAIPPLGGWAAATGELSLGAWVLFAILFLWQHPHFYAIAWMYKEDYINAGLKMLPAVEPDGLSTFRQILIYSVLLIPVSLLPTLIGMSGEIYMVGALLLGLMLLAGGIALFQTHSLVSARRLIKASLIYLPALLLLIVTDAGF